MAELALTACRRCREQKLKCSREQPNCSRCVRLGAVCTYPDPPDRKLIASQRAPARKRQRSLETSLEDESPARPLHQHQGPISMRHDGVTNELEFEIPNRNLQSMLQDVYFACAFNSSLTFHQPSLKRAWVEGKLPLPVMLSICAVGTHFVTSNTAWTERCVALGGPLQGIRTSAKQWALWAGRQVLQNMDQPDLDGVKVCEVLSLYWFLMDDPQRNAVFTGIAYRAARTLCLDDENEESDSAELQETASSHPKTWIQSEELRRCFWAAWMQTCINADHYIVGTSDDIRAMEIALPINDTSFGSEQQEEHVTLATLQNDVSESRMNRRKPSLMAELMNLVHDWAKVRDHVEARKRLTAREALADFFLFNQKLSDSASGLPADFAYSKQNLFNHLMVKHEPNYVTIHALIHQCKIALHSSLVPQYTKLPPQKGIPDEVIKTSARIVLQKAHAISEICANILDLKSDVAQLAPFFGYCTYIAASIHTAFMSSKHPRLAMSARTDLLSSLKILVAMKSYWKNLERLWARFLLFYQEQVETFEVSPLWLSDTELSGIENFEGDNLDLSSRLKSAAGQFAEPYGDAALQYKLGKGKIHSSRSAVSASTFGVANTRMSEDGPLPATLTQSDHATQPIQAVANPTPSKQQDDIEHRGEFHDLLNNNNEDWWDSNMEVLLGRALSYDDMFQENFSL